MKEYNHYRDDVELDEDGNPQKIYPETDDEGGCPKCGHRETEIDDIATTGTGLSKLFDVQNRRFKVISCTNCGYAELYKGGHTHDLADLFFG